MGIDQQHSINSDVTAVRELDQVICNSYVCKPDAGINPERHEQRLSEAERPASTFEIDQTSPHRPSRFEKVSRRLNVWSQKSRIAIENIRNNHQPIKQILFKRKFAPVRAEIIRQPAILKFVAMPFLCSHWDAKTRIDRIIDHCLQADKLGRPFSRMPKSAGLLTRLPGELGPYALAFRTPLAMVREGLLTLSILHDSKPMFDLSFILASGPDGVEVYVGAVQGRAHEDALDLYRTFTKAACGVRPRDFVVEAFRIICRNIGVVRIHAVSNATRHQQSAYFSIGATDYDQVKMDYDELWTERGGEPGSDGRWFMLSPDTPQRALETVPSRKRSLYKRRAAMWQEVETGIAAAMTAHRTQGV